MKRWWPNHETAIIIDRCCCCCWYICCFVCSWTISNRSGGGEGGAETRSTVTYTKYGDPTLALVDSCPITGIRPQSRVHNPACLPIELLFGVTTLALAIGPRYRPFATSPGLTVWTRQYLDYVCTRCLRYVHSASGSISIWSSKQNKMLPDNSYRSLDYISKKNNSLILHIHHGTGTA